MSELLIGNTFPLTLVRRKLTIEPVSLERFRRMAVGQRVVSFWGHANTLHAASAAVGFDLAPRTERPVLTLSPDGLPAFEGQTFRECWIVSPDYCCFGFRPEIGAEVPPSEISGWKILKLTWE